MFACPVHDDVLFKKVTIMVMKPFWSLLETTFYQMTSTNPAVKWVAMKYSWHLGIHGALQTLVGYIFFSSLAWQENQNLSIKLLCIDLPRRSPAQLCSGRAACGPDVTQFAAWFVCETRNTKRVLVCQRAALLSMCHVTRQLVSRSYRFQHLPMQWGEKPICPVQGLSIILTWRGCDLGVSLKSYVGEESNQWSPPWRPPSNDW